MEAPKDFDPSKMTPPEGMEPPKDFAPSAIPPHDGFGDRDGNFGDNMSHGETSTVFTIVNGGNNFMGIAEN